MSIRWQRSGGNEHLHGFQKKEDGGVVPAAGEGVFVSDKQQNRKIKNVKCKPYF